MAAFYPYFSHGRPTAMFVVGSQTASAWTAADQAVFLAVGRSLGQALAWTTQAEELSAQNEALDAFTRFTEATADTTEIPALASRAWDVLRATLGDVSVAFYNLEDGLWQVKAWSPDVTEPFLRRMLQGFTEDTPRFVNAVRAGGPVFVPGWSTTSEGLPPDPRYGALASYPYFLDGRALSLLSVGAKDKVNWTDREEGVIRAVGRSLGLALERAQQAQQLISQRDALNLRTQDLQAANEELEAFTYSASHDLRTPVRHVMGFAELAQKALLATPNEKAHQHLEVVKQGAVRMTALIDGMLVLSRAGRDGLQPRSFALQPLVAQSIRDVGQEFPGRPVRWHLGTFPAVWGDPALVQQVLTNLLSNAVKYSGSRAVSAVKVWCEEDASEWVIRVQDNGVGFDAKYAAKLFGIFQRLHPDRDFQGTGVGLAIVRRIVVKHGGRVFAESPEAAGATFGFTLPKRSAS